MPIDPIGTFNVSEISYQNLEAAGRCNGTFTINSKLILNANDNIIRYTIVSTPGCEKQYAPQAVDYTSYINHPDQTIFLALLDGQPAGEIRLKRHWTHYAWLDDVVVDVAARRRGVGQALIERAKDWARGKQLAGIMLETQNNNVGACLLYERCGFKLAGFDEQLYKGLDAANNEIALFWYWWP
jgi:streptothricin acetyltransferase